MYDVVTTINIIDVLHCSGPRLIRDSSDWIFWILSQVDQAPAAFVIWPTVHVLLLRSRSNWDRGPTVKIGQMTGATHLTEVVISIWPRSQQWGVLISGKLGFPVVQPRLNFLPRVSPLVQPRLNFRAATSAGTCLNSRTVGAVDGDIGAPAGRQKCKPCFCSRGCTATVCGRAQVGAE